MKTKLILDLLYGLRQADQAKFSVGVQQMQKKSARSGQNRSLMTWPTSRLTQLRRNPYPFALTKPKKIKCAQLLIGNPAATVIKEV